MTEMSMRERVARALGDKYLGGYDREPRLWNELAEDAMKAMREITTSMLEATTYADSFTEAWEKAIDEALLEGRNQQQRQAG